MTGVEKRTVSLPAELAGYIDRSVASGAYASASEVVRAGLRALRERDDAVERWLREEVVPVATAMHADSGRAVPADDLFDELRVQRAAAPGVVDGQ
jgi:antitoxin ParD1/3/4